MGTRLRISVPELCICPEHPRSSGCSLQSSKSSSSDVVIVDLRDADMVADDDTCFSRPEFESGVADHYLLRIPFW